MVWYNLTVDDISPLISYNGTWESLTMNNPGSEAAADIQSFHNKTLHVLNSVGWAKLQFVGRAISVWGPSRPDSSQYEVRLDDQVVSTGGSDTVSNESALLYSVRGLAPGLLHTLQISNVPLEPQRQWLRIDKFVVESGTDGSDNIETGTIDDTSSKIHYTLNKKHPWLSGTGDKSTYHDGTFHIANMNQTSLGFTTDGDSVEIYGGQDSDFSSFSVTVDGIQRNFTPNVRDFQSPVLLFQTEFLQKSDQHTVQVEILEDKRFEFDFVRVLKYRDSSQSITGDGTSLTNASVQTTPPSSSSFDSMLSGPAIAGIVLGCLAVLVLFSLALLLWWRKKRRRLPPSAAFASLNMDLPQKNTPIYEEFSSVYRSQSNGTVEQSTKRCMDLLDGQPEPVNVERSKFEPYLLMYKTGAVRSAYEATLRPEDSASFHVRSPPASEVGSQIQSDYVTHFTPTASVALPPVSEQ